MKNVNENDSHYQNFPDYTIIVLKSQVVIKNKSNANENDSHLRSADCFLLSPTIPDNLIRVKRNIHEYNSLLYETIVVD